MNKILFNFKKESFLRVCEKRYVLSNFNNGIYGNLLKSINFDQLRYREHNPNKIPIIFLNINFNLFSMNINNNKRFLKFKFSTFSTKKNKNKLNNHQSNNFEKNLKLVLEENQIKETLNLEKTKDSEFNNLEDCEKELLKFDKEYEEDLNFNAKDQIKNFKKNVVNNDSEVKICNSYFSHPEKKINQEIQKDKFKESIESYNHEKDEILKSINSKKLIPRTEIRKMIKEDDLIIMKKVRGSGPGGQHLNKTSSSVFMKDPKTNIAIKVSQSRDSIVNEGVAKKRLLDKLDVFYNGKDSKLEKKNEKIKKQKSKATKRSAQKHSNNIDKKK